MQSSIAGLRYYQNTTDPERAKFMSDCQDRITAFTTPLVFFSLEFNAIEDDDYSALFDADPAIGQGDEAGVLIEGEIAATDQEHLADLEVGRGEVGEDLAFAGDGHVRHHDVDLSGLDGGQELVPFPFDEHR